MSESSQPYRVLARKYRPQTFAELIGQEAMVRTLANAIESDRLAHAFLLTGVRGVGKTSTARLIAKALNCIGPDGKGGPRIDPCGTCEPCGAIAEGRHIDVIEMDAASHTGVDDVREIIEAVRYAAVTARYKIYIVDEVHMLSKNAFNALLKTLEEPPPHVKFLFATTEIEKVPVTVLSRCQRFDLRRIPFETLRDHFAAVAKAEVVEIEPDALALIARAAEGSARDGLSILDQAIAFGEGAVRADQVRSMLGLADRGSTRRLLGMLLEGDAAGALAALRNSYDLGVEPSSMLKGLLEAVHGVTLAKIGGAPDPAQAPEDREALASWAAKLSHAALHRFWQLLLKGLNDVTTGPAPFEAAEMALLRIIHASDLPDPGELARSLPGTAREAPAPAAPEPPQSETQEPLLQAPADFAGLVALLEARGEAMLAHQLSEEFRLVDYAPPMLRLQAARALDSRRVEDAVARLRAFVKLHLKASWQVVLDEGAAQPTLREQELEAERDAEQRIRDVPIVQAALDTFPHAELAGFTTNDKRSD